MAELFANILNTQDGMVTTLAAAIVTVDGESITTAGVLPVELRDGECRLRIDDELMIATVDEDGHVTSVERGAEGSTAATHAISSRVRHVLTAGSLAAQNGSTVIVTTSADPAPDPTAYPAGTLWIQRAL